MTSLNPSTRRLSSPNLAEDQERRVLKEIQRLKSDIRRISPEGESWCTFGELFTDPLVEQYYEALVGTMKAAKRKGCITFDGQFLLKGLHDHVVVRLIEDDSLTMKTTVSLSDNTSELVRVCSASEGNSSGMANSSNDRDADGKNLLCLSHSLDQEYQEDSNLIEVTNDSMNITESNMNTSEVSCPTTSENTTKQYTSIPPIETSITLQKLNNVSISPKMDIHFTVQSEIKPKIQPSTSSTSKHKHTETHDGRIERETNQLMFDIRRIHPEGEPYCSFGDLFDDPTVEQYYEALVGTLKSAKRKGMVSFEGQMLLKGMHDNVRIDIMEN